MISPRIAPHTSADAVHTLNPIILVCRDDEWRRVSVIQTVRYRSGTLPFGRDGGNSCRTAHPNSQLN